MARTRLRGAAAVAAALALGGLGFEARADQGNAVIDSKQPGSVVLNGHGYRISDSTVVEDREGNGIGYAQLPTLEQGASADAAAVWFEASDDERSPVLYRLRLTGSVPD
jgi:hypothetical protein